MKGDAIMAYTYMLRCCDGSLYTGWTNDLVKRLAAHSSGKGARYTRSHRPVSLAYFECSATKEDAMRREYQIKQLTRKERTHRLCTRGGMLESFLQEPERLTDDDVMLLLKLIFHRQDMQELLKKLLEREKPETP